MSQGHDIVIEMQGKRYALSKLPRHLLYDLLQQIEQQYHTGCIDVGRVRHQEGEHRLQIAAYVNQIRALGCSPDEVISFIGAAESKDEPYTTPDLEEESIIPTPNRPLYNTSAGKLYIITRTGYRIQMPTSRRTLLEGIRQAGFGRVYAMQIPYMKGLLVDIKPNPLYPKFTFHEGDYYITIGNSDVPRMLRIAQKISNILYLDWTVGIEKS